eukprot:g3549.t1
MTTPNRSKKQHLYAEQFYGLVSKHRIELLANKSLLLFRVVFPLLVAVYLQTRPLRKGAVGDIDMSASPTYEIPPIARCFAIDSDDGPF